MQTRHVTFIILLCLLCASTPTPAQQAAQPASVALTTRQLAGPGAPVTVRRDGRGIPYIEAANEDDLHFALGYVMASDRLWQMDLLRRTARGELAEIFGRAALEEDKRRRLYGFAQVTEATAARLDAPARRVLDAYARGVNAYINSLDAKTLPAEFQLLGYRPRAWTPADTLAVGKIFAEVLTRPWRADVQRAAVADLAPEARRALLDETSPLDVLLVANDNARLPTTSRTGAHTRDAQALDYQGSSAAERRATLAALTRDEALTRRTFERVGLYLEDFAASNNWVVSGRRTASGKPLLANDPHLPPSAPSIWYMAHLTINNPANKPAQSLRVAGVAAPGAPGIIIGHNEQIAWGVTNFGPDVQDVFIETFDPQQPLRYRTPDGWTEATVRREAIKVRKGFADASTEIVPFDVTVTRNGPIVFESAGKRYALRWSALEPSDTSELEAFYALDRARNWTEFQTALNRYTGPTQNFIYADRDGNIGYYAAGRIPLRRDGGGASPYVGSTRNGERIGYIPFAELPHVFNPPSGIIVTANNRLVGRSYPYFLGDEWAAPYRARRIYDLLQAAPKHTPESFRRIQADSLSIGGATFTREAVKLLRSDSLITGRMPDPNKQLLAAAIALLTNWNGRVEPDSRVAPLVAEMRASFRLRLLTALLGAERARNYRGANVENFLDYVLTNQPAAMLPENARGYADLMDLCLIDARAALTKRLGADETKWTWAAYSPARFPHPLAAAPLIGGRFAITPITVGGTGGQPGATVNVGANVSMRLIADVNDWDATQQGITPGISGDPASAHWTDQLADWQAATPAVFPFTTDAVKRATVETLVLNPAK